jgi:Spy/CpxP family protein refolding chaperone
MKRTIVAGLALAFTLGGATLSNAQQSERGDRDGRRGGMGFLMKGIELTDAQKDQIKALHKQEGAATDKAEMEKRHEAVKAARERGDTAALRTFRTEMMEHRKQRHEAMLTSVRAILTPAQREVFEKNVAAMQERMKRGHDGMRGKRGQHSEHGDHKTH